jgi:hypothetical protein
VAIDVAHQDWTCSCRPSHRSVVLMAAGSMDENQALNASSDPSHELFALSSPFVVRHTWNLVSNTTHRYQVPKTVVGLLG